MGHMVTQHALSTTIRTRMRRVHAGCNADNCDVVLLLDRLDSEERLRRHWQARARPETQP